MISNPNPSIWVHAAQSSRRSARALTVRWPDALVHRQAEAFARWQGRIRREFQIQTASGSGCQSPGRLACANSDNSEPLTLRAMAAKRRKGRSNHRRRAKTAAFQSAAPTCLFGGDIQIWRDGRAITSCASWKPQEPIASMAPHVSQPDRNALLSAQRRLWLGAVILGDGGGFEPGHVSSSYESIVSRSVAGSDHQT